MKPKVDLEAPGVVSSHCEFCGQTYYIDPNQGLLMHELPMCPEFEVMDPMSFVVQNREIKQDRHLSGSNN